MTEEKKVTDEHLRQAAEISVSISNFTGGAALAVIAASGALFTWAKQTSRPGWLFYGFVLSGVVCLVWSFITGGRAASALASAGREGNWAPRSKFTCSFNGQAIATLLGLLFTIAGACAATVH